MSVTFEYKYIDFHTKEQIKKLSSAKLRLFYLGLNALIADENDLTQSDYRV